MSSLSRLERRVDRTLHSVIVEFDPEVPDTYSKCAGGLIALQREIETAELEPTARGSLLARVRTQLALMAFEVGYFAEAERLSADVLKSASTREPSFALALLMRTQALHRLERHEEEVADALECVALAGLSGPSLLYLLAELSRHHPDRMIFGPSVIPRVEAYVAESPELEKRLRDLMPSKADPVEYVLTVHAVDRELNLERTARFLGNVK